MVVRMMVCTCAVRSRDDDIQYRKGIGTDTTHYRVGTQGITHSTRWAAVWAKRAPYVQHRGYGSNGKCRRLYCTYVHYSRKNNSGRDKEGKAVRAARAALPGGVRRVAARRSASTTGSQNRREHG